MITCILHRLSPCFSWECSLNLVQVHIGCLLPLPVLLLTHYTTPQTHLLHHLLLVLIRISWWCIGEVALPGGELGCLSFEVSYRPSSSTQLLILSSTRHIMFK